MKPTKPRREGYGAAYRTELQQEFLGPDGARRLGNQSAWMREAVSRMLKEIENRRADVEALEAALRRAHPFIDEFAAAGNAHAPRVARQIRAALKETVKRRLK